MFEVLNTQIEQAEVTQAVESPAVAEIITRQYRQTRSKQLLAID